MFFWGPRCCPLGKVPWLEGKTVYLVLYCVWTNLMLGAVTVWIREGWGLIILMYAR